VSGLGRRGEDDAVAFLLGKGYRIMHRNYQTPLGEADIVARDRDTLVFAEVKARTSDRFGQPFEAVDPRKQERIRRIALYFLKQHRLDAPVRFEVISLLYRDGRAEITHVVDGFGF
jgi:putative endonuclease